MKGSCVRLYATKAPFIADLAWAGAGLDVDFVVRAPSGTIGMLILSSSGPLTGW